MTFKSKELWSLGPAVPALAGDEASGCTGTARGSTPDRRRVLHGPEIVPEGRGASRHVATWEQRSRHLGSRGCSMAPTPRGRGLAPTLRHVALWDEGRTGARALAHAPRSRCTVFFPNSFLRPRFKTQRVTARPKADRTREVPGATALLTPGTAAPGPRRADEGRGGNAGTERSAAPGLGGKRAGQAWASWTVALWKPRSDALERESQTEGPQPLMGPQHRGHPPEPGCRWDRQGGSRAGS